MKMATIKPPKDDMTSTNSDPAVSEPGDETSGHRRYIETTKSLMVNRRTDVHGREKYLRARYGLTIEAVELMTALQRNRCSVCSEERDLLVRFNKETLTFKMNCRDCILTGTKKVLPPIRKTRVKVTAPTL